MPTMVVKASDVIANPQSPPTVVASVNTSDTFSSSNGDIYGRSTDCKLGGQAVNWRDFPPFAGQGVYEIKDGVLVATVNANAGVVGPNIIATNLGIQFKIARFDSAIPEVGDNWSVFADLRRVLGSSKTYRLGFNKNGVALVYRSESGSGEVLGRTAFAVGDTILYTAINNSHKVYINGVLKIDVLNAGYVGSGYASLSRAPNNSHQGVWAIDDLIIYSI